MNHIMPCPQTLKTPMYDISYTEPPMSAQYILYLSRADIVIFYCFLQNYPYSVDHETAGGSPKIGERTYVRSPIFGNTFDFREVLILKSDGLPSKNWISIQIFTQHSVNLC